MTDRPIIELPTLPDAPDFLGKARRVEEVASLIASAQEQALSVRNTMLINGDEPGDKIPVANPAEKRTTYAERMAKLASGVEALLDANSDIADELAEDAIGRRKRMAEAIEKAHQDQ